MVVRSNLEDLEKEITDLLIACIGLYGKDGMFLQSVDREFKEMCGFSVPYEKFGCDSLRSFLITLPEIYVVTDEIGHEVVIEQSKKSEHIRNLIMKQRSSKRKANFGYYQYNYGNQEDNVCYTLKKKRVENRILPQGSFIHNSINDKNLNNSDRHEPFEKLESMLPLIYRHQALGDDFFVDLADTKMGYYIFESEESKSCGLCSTGQTIAELTEKVKKADYLAPRVAVMIGLNDLLKDRNANNMIIDLRELIVELKARNTRVTLLTLVPTPKLPKCARTYFRLEIYNKAIMEYAYDSDLQCNIIDLYTIFLNEQANLKRDFDRFEKIAKNDNYKVFSDYGRKVFLNTVKSCLKEQIQSGH